MKRFVIYVAITVGMAVTIAGCAARRTPYDYLYASLKEEPKEHDWSVLRGRRIVIDPGHGGKFEGAVGADSLTEADANLGVALYLWGLLEEAGADVYLTRTTDRDFLPEGSSDLRDDLDGRIVVANELEPEAFISIHHNSNLALNREMNKVEIYYKSSDPGASLELAQDIHIHLARNLGIEETEIKPGNYFVLRNSDAGASVLCEASYISHPAVEEKLKISNKQRLEAEAYFLGLIEYFSRGVPVIERVAPESDTIRTPAEITFAVRQGAGVPIDPASAAIKIGKNVETPLFIPETGMIRCSLKPDIPNGTYGIVASVRSVRGAAARSKPFTLLLARPAEYILPLPARKEPDSLIALRVKVLDELGLPVADGTDIKALSQETGGIAIGKCQKGYFSFMVREELASGSFILELPEKKDTIRFALDGEQESIPVLVIDEQTGDRISFPSATYGQGRETFVTGDSHGRMFIPPSPRPEMLFVIADGYRPELFNVNGDIEKHIIPLQPFFNGILKSRRIAIDPAGGGPDHGGRGVNGLRGASVNLEVAKLLQLLLERSGAKVSMTRHGEENLSAEERVYKINRCFTELAIGIHHGSYEGRKRPECFVAHYPGSNRGRSLAEELSLSLGGLPPCKEFEIIESDGIFLQQTSCPACEIHCGSVGEESTEKILSNLRYPGMEAQRILSAVLRFLGGEAWECSSQTIKVAKNGIPLEGVLICIDQALTAISDGDGLAWFPCIIPGKHLITYELPGGESHSRMFEFSGEDSRELIICIPDDR